MLKMIEIAINTRKSITKEENVEEGEDRESRREKR